MSATIKCGDVVRIKPQWQDAGDDRFIWRAMEDEDGGRVRIYPTNTGLVIPPNQIVDVSMLEWAPVPNLIEALERTLNLFVESHADELMSNHHEDGPDCSYCRQMNAARAAIAKAKGGAQ